MEKLSSSIKQAAEQTKQDLRAVERKLNNVVSMKQETHKCLEPKIAHLLKIE